MLVGGVGSIVTTVHQLAARTVLGFGDVAQLGEHLLCKQGVVGSIPIVSTKLSPGKLSLGKLSLGKLPSASFSPLGGAAFVSWNIRDR